MFSCYVFLWISLLNIPRLPHVSACDFNCADKPIITPSRLVVKYGDPASATCVACQQACLPLSESRVSMEVNTGNTAENGTTLTWTVDRLTEWVLNPKCFYTDSKDNQCCTNLDVTVYQPPKNVSISLNHDGPLNEHKTYTLQCSVMDVAPVKNLVVTFYRGKTLLDYRTSNNTKSPANEIFTLSFNASREDNRAQFWCEAKLELGAEGPQPPLVVKSETLTATVHYGPELKVPANPDPISITKGDTLQLNCSAEGNPDPLYSWLLPSKKDSSNNHFLIIKSVDNQDEGEYVCTVSGNKTTDKVKFTVKVKENNLILIIVAIVSAVLLLLIIAALIYHSYYKQKKMGKYRLKDVFRLGTVNHTTVPLVM